MLGNVALGALLLVLTTAVHGGAMVLALDGMRLMHVRTWATRSLLTKLGVVCFLVVLLFLASVVESALWAFAYLALGALTSFGEALYFSVVTFTTLGYGDVTLDVRWRLLGSFQAANGTIMFGWSTALIMAVVNRLYTHGTDEKPA